MKKRIAGIKEITRLFESLEAELDELEFSYDLQFNSSANLHDKLLASKRAKATFKRIRRLRARIAKSLNGLND